MGISFKTGLAASAYHGGWCLDEFLAGYLHLFHDFIPLGEILFVSLQDMTHGMKFNERAREIGFRDGDILLRADEKPLERFGMDMLRDIAEARTVTVSRDGKETEVYMPEISLLDIAKDDPMFVTALVPNVLTR